MYCSHCGAQNPPEAAFCQYCGSPLGAPSSAPLPATTPPPSPAPGGWGGPGGYPGGPSPAPPPPRRRSLARTIVIILVVVVVVILVLGVIAYLFLPATSTINVTGINFTSPDNACGLNGATSDGFTANTSQAYAISFYISGTNTSNGGTAACNITSVSTTTSGFSISGANVPLIIPVNATQILSFNVNTPGSSYSGVLTLVIT